MSIKGQEVGLNTPLSYVFNHECRQLRKEGFLPTGVAVIVSKDNQSNPMVLLVRSPRDNTWNFPQGGIVAGIDGDKKSEDLVAGTRREVGEEILSLQQDRLNLLGYIGHWKLPMPEGRRPTLEGFKAKAYFGVAFEYEDSETKLTWDPAEVAEAAWVRVDQFQVALAGKRLEKAEAMTAMLQRAITLQQIKTNNFL